MTRARLAAACAFALALVAMPVAHADWKRDYGFGQAAFEKGDWAEAEAKMKAAMAEEPGASARKRMQGTRFELYAPAHYAAVAAFKQGACGRALQYLDDGATKSVVAGIPNLAAEAQQVRSGCGGGSNVAATPTETPAAPTPSAPAPAPKPATPIAVAPDKPAPPPVAAPKAEVRPPEAAPVAPAPTTTSTAPPAALRTAVRAFIAGDYSGALRVSDAGIADTKGRALVLMVRAAAGYTQAELKGGDAALVARADADVRASKRLARIDPDTSLFSPKVRAAISRVR